MLRRAGPQDAAALEAFLAGHAASSMFLRGNLEAHGTQEMKHRHGTAYFIREDDDGIEAVVGCTNGGYLMCQAPAQGAGFWREVATVLRGRQVAGMTGVPEQIEALAAALGFGRSEFGVYEVEPLYVRRLDDLPDVPKGCVLRNPTADDIAFLADWFDGYHRDTGLIPPQTETARHMAQGFLEDVDARILDCEGAAVAMASLNARAVDTVQVGGVYVPPALRGRGYGGAVVTLQMAELAKAGMARAVLFAANASAARAYEKIGFQRVGCYLVALLKSSRMVGVDAAR